MSQSSGREHRVGRTLCQTEVCQQPYMYSQGRGGQELGHMVVPLRKGEVALFWMIFIASFACVTRRCLRGV